MIFDLHQQCGDPKGKKVPFFTIIVTF
jgi:hypothetical protein